MRINFNESWASIRVVNYFLKMCFESHISTDLEVRNFFKEEEKIKLKLSTGFSFVFENHFEIFLNKAGNGKKNGGEKYAVKCNITHKDCLSEKKYQIRCF